MIQTIAQNQGGFLSWPLLYILFLFWFTISDDALDTEQEPLSPSEGQNQNFAKVVTFEAELLRLVAEGRVSRVEATVGK